MQNAQLIGVLLLSAAECYSKILDSLTLTDHIAGNANAKRTVSLRSLDNDVVAESAFDLAFTIELDEAEWRCLAKKSLLHEIHDTSDTLRPCFMHVLSNLERRQVFWHTVSPPPDAPTTFQTSCSLDRPVCLLVADQARRLIDSLKFG
ncbi:uncharacterized protein Z519_07088 [Cladophialophora bantiana CBS 173.52]|uniref:Uncharacterized protein n=1 Tax=Cladophialophora bantiana (strain ATCC 10958 / CBS 173.52 / CDC B-1940 / NIH 8579) TaxID=1442370 RepID=A0A0D2I5D6_CLAB1|nr:uncharacterized protein Z519_07088 [Cladophialophora bantiana CBS 173.52]KIW92104.1 hypothetical protein Z519_07088 [Cladophialophora bantiana CBS 173.52]